MRKIPSVFVRDFEGNRSLVTRQINSECQWVLDGEGQPTEKSDGTACMVRDGQLFARFDRKRGKPAPPDWEACQPECDPVTGHWPGWVPVRDEPQFKWHREALEGIFGCPMPDGTYELVGPRINGNPHGLVQHHLLRHGHHALEGVPRDFDGIREWLSTHVMEGIVWHHADGRMAKIKASDFGLKWPRKD